MISDVIKENAARKIGFESICEYFRILFLNKYEYIFSGEIAIEIEKALLEHLLLLQKWQIFLRF